MKNGKFTKFGLILLGLGVAMASSAIEDKKRKEEIKKAVEEYHKKENK